MISKTMENKIDKFFPELGYGEFIQRFGVPDIDLTTLNLAECQDIDVRIMNVAQDLAAEKSYEEQMGIAAREMIQRRIYDAIAKTAMKKEYKYKDITNMNSDKKISLTNDLSRKAFAHIIVWQMVTDKVLIDPVPHEQRAAILTSVWFSIIEIGKRVDDWNLAERGKIKRMKG